MTAILLIALWISLQVICVASIRRGPHHPKSTVSHDHHKPQQGVKLTEDINLLHDTTHLEEDIGLVGLEVDFSNLTEQEIEFQYFKVHDADNNTKLDGLEMLRAIQHTYHLNKDDEENVMQDDEEWIIELIDRVLEEDDVNNNGYLEYVEYVMGRQRDHMAQEKRKKLRIGS